MVSGNTAPNDPIVRNNYCFVVEFERNQPLWHLFNRIRMRFTYYWAVVSHRRDWSIRVQDKNVVFEHNHVLSADTFRRPNLLQQCFMGSLLESWTDFFWPRLNEFWASGNKFAFRGRALPIFKVVRNFESLVLADVDVQVPALDLRYVVLVGSHLEQ